MIHEEKTQTTCVLRLFGAPLWAVQQAVQQTGLAAQCRSRGAETLAALQTETPAALSKARKALADRFAAELYGEGEMTLVHAAVQALETHHRLLVCCDADAGTLLEARMETVAGAEKVFDFGAMSYADAKVREKLSAKVCRVKGGPVPAKLTRVRAAQRLVGADFAAGCLERAEDTVLFLGSRKGYGAMSYHPHNIPLFLLGASMLWMGWFCFNCGCAGGANSIAVLAFANTALSSAASMVVWMLIEALVQKKCTVMGAVTGGIVGLVGITPGAGYVPLWSSLIIGATAAPICYLAISKMKKKFGYDDALDAFGCHGVGGIWGGIVTGIFATKQMNDAVPQEGLLFGDYRLFLSQLGAIGISIAVAVVMTTIIMLVLKKCGGVRVSDLEEAQGLDLIEHGERAYPAFNGLD